MDEVTGIGPEDTDTMSKIYEVAKKSPICMDKKTESIENAGSLAAKKPMPKMKMPDASEREPALIKAKIEFNLKARPLMKNAK